MCRRYTPGGSARLCPAGAAADGDCHNDPDLQEVSGNARTVSTTHAKPPIGIASYDEVAQLTGAGAVGKVSCT